MKVTSNGKITIPHHIREKMGIEPNCEVDFVEENGRFYLIKINASSTVVENPFRKYRGVATVKMSTEEIMALTRDR